MNSRVWIKKALTSILSVSIIATYTMVAFAAPSKTIGEITVSGKNVTVNGEVAQNGRTLFTASSIATTNDSSASVSLNTGGKLEIAPNTSITADSNETFTLFKGKVTSFSETSINVVANGKTTKLNRGESSTINPDDERDSTGKCIDKDGDGKLECDDASGSAWWIWTLVFGGAAAGIVIAALSDNNRVSLGGGTTVVSPIR